jgi:hypothetical protein
MALEQILCAIYVALTEASGGPQARAVANRVLLDAINDQAVDNEEAVKFLKSFCGDDPDGLSAMH